jgi:uncharacterized protein (TIGR02996 family)
VRTPKLPPTELKPFLLAVAADPFDDAPRLILSDYLDEHGECERAELIRVQIAANRSPNDKRLAERCRQLILSHWSEWIWPLVTHGKPDWFRRGFLEQVRLTCTTFINSAGTLFQYQPIVRVRLNTGGEYGSSHVYFDGSMVTRGGQARVPGPIFPFLENVGHNCIISGARATFGNGRHDVLPAFKVVSRAAVNFGRHQAGLPALSWKPIPTASSWATQGKPETYEEWERRFEEP